MPSSPTPTATATASAPIPQAHPAATPTQVPTATPTPAATATPSAGETLPAPTDLSAQGRRRSIALDWDGSSWKVRYNVYRSTTPGIDPSVSRPYVTGVLGTRYVDTDVRPGVTYYYVVTATDGRRESRPSNEASAQAR